MGIRRGQKIQKISIQEVQNIVKERRHRLIHYEVSKRDSTLIPKSSVVRLFCEKCNFEWQTKLGTYLQRHTISGGCRQCYNINVFQKNLYKNSPCLPKVDVLNRPKRRSSFTELKNSHSLGQFLATHTFKTENL